MWWINPIGSIWKSSKLIAQGRPQTEVTRFGIAIMVGREFVSRPVWFLLIISVLGAFALLGVTAFVFKSFNIAENGVLGIVSSLYLLAYPLLVCMAFAMGSAQEKLSLLTQAPSTQNGSEYSI